MLVNTLLFVLGSSLIPSARSSLPRDVVLPRVNATAALPPCFTSLSCTFAQIEQIPIVDRLSFVIQLESGPLAQFGASRKLRNIEAVVDFFIDTGLGAPRSWVSLVDAGILEGIQNGAAIASGISQNTGGNPGSQIWANYFTRLRRGELNTREVHDRAWSEAEQAATEHGVAVAEASNVSPTNVQQRWFLFSQLYRWIMRNRVPARALLMTLGIPVFGPRIIFLADDFIDWLTDVENRESSRLGVQVAWETAQFDGLGLVVAWVELARAYLPTLFEEFLALRR